MSPIPLGILASSGAGGAYGWIQELDGGVSYPGYQVAYEPSSNTWYPGIMDNNGFGSARASGFSKVDGETGQALSGGISILRAGSFSRTFATGFDNNGDILVGSSEGGNQGNGQIYKISPAGSTIWNLRSSQINSTVTSVAFDSANNYYFTGNHEYGSTSSYLLKTDSSGTVIWHKRLANVFGQGFRVDVDSNDDVYVAVGVFGSPTRLSVQKWSSAGVLQWTRRMSNYNGNVADLCVTDNDEIVVSWSDTSDTQNIISLSTSNTVNYHKAKSNNMQLARMSKGPDGAVHIVWQSPSGGSWRHELMRVESGFSSAQVTEIQSSNTFITGLGSDENDQVYVLGRTSNEDWECLNISNNSATSSLYGTYAGTLRTWVIGAPVSSSFSDASGTDTNAESTGGSTFTWSSAGETLAAYQPTYSLLAIP